MSSSADPNNLDLSRADEIAQLTSRIARFEAEMEELQNADPPQFDFHLTVHIRCMRKMLEELKSENPGILGEEEDADEEEIEVEVPAEYVPLPDSDSDSDWESCSDSNSSNLKSLNISSKRENDTLHASTGRKGSHSGSENNTLQSPTSSNVSHSGSDESTLPSSTGSSINLPKATATDGTGNLHSNFNQTKLATLTDDDYEADRRRNIAAVERHINRCNAELEATQRGLTSLHQRLNDLRAMPEGPMIDPTEPQHLPMRVLKRIEVLKMWAEDRDKKGGPTANIRAVLEAYRSGKLDVRPGWVSYWKGGVCVRELGPRLSPDEEVGMLLGWAKEGLPGSNWVENVVPMESNSTDTKVDCEEKPIPPSAIEMEQKKVERRGVVPCIFKPFLQSFRPIFTRFKH